MSNRTNRTGWSSLLEWALALGLLALALVGAASIGTFVAPFAIVAIAVAVRRNRDWPEAPLGGLVGMGAVCLFVAYRQRAYFPCPPSGTPTRLGPGPHLACGGFNPVSWLAVGVLLTAAGLVGYLAFRRTHREGAA